MKVFRIAIMDVLVYCVDLRNYISHFVTFLLAITARI